MNTKDIPAFPCQREHGPQLDSAEGMSLRDYFAAKALPACYAESCKEFERSGWPPDWKVGVAIDAYAMADAMMAAREASNAGK